MVFRSDRIYGERVRRFIARIENVLFDAYRRMDADREAVGGDPPLPEEVNIFSWPQTWPDWSCGFGGDARQEPCTDQTNVVVDEVTGAVYVYHASRYVTTVVEPTDAFWVRVKAHDLPAARATDEWAGLDAA